MTAQGRSEKPNARGNSPLWGITCFFNPMGYRRKLPNYRLFRERLDVPLVTVEVYYGEKPELNEGDADVLIQIPGSDVLWQKEHLLTLALRSVPQGCERIVWLDCDLVLVNDEWPERAADLLETFPLVQVFGELREIRAEILKGRSDVTEIADPKSESLDPRSLSFAHKLLKLRSMSLENALASGHHQAPTTRAGTGIGWAFRREVFAERGFYNGSVIGGNDRAMACAALGKFDIAERNWRMNTHQRDHYRAWAESYYRTVDGQIAYLDQCVLHLSHGSLGNRGYGSRHRGLVQFGFDPWRDVTAEENGPLQWGTAKDELHRYVRDWFASRKEDDEDTRDRV